MIPDTPAALLRLIDRARLERGRLENALARAGWPWILSVSLWIDYLVIEEEERAAWTA
jgi:hypothetical protein